MATLMLEYGDRLEIMDVQPPVDTVVDGNARRRAPADRVRVAVEPAGPQADGFEARGYCLRAGGFPLSGDHDDMPRDLRAALEFLARAEGLRAVTVNGVAFWSAMPSDGDVDAMMAV